MTVFDSALPIQEGVTKKVTIIFVLIRSAALLLAEEAKEQAVAPKLVRKITIRIEGSAMPQYAPIFNALEKGFSAEEVLGCSI